MAATSTGISPSYRRSEFGVDRYRVFIEPTATTRGVQRGWSETPFSTCADAVRFMLGFLHAEDVYGAIGIRRRTGRPPRGGSYARRPDVALPPGARAEIRAWASAAASARLRGDPIEPRVESLKDRADVIAIPRRRFRGVIAETAYRLYGVIDFEELLREFNAWRAGLGRAPVMRADVKGWCGLTRWPRPNHTVWEWLGIPAAPPPLDVIEAKDAAPKGDEERMSRTAFGRMCLRAGLDSAGLLRLLNRKTGLGMGRKYTRREIRPWIYDGREPPAVIADEVRRYARKRR